MLHCCRETQLLFRDDRRRAVRPHRILLALVALVVPAWTQQPTEPVVTIQPDQQAEQRRTLPSGIWLNGISGYAEGDLLRAPYAAGDPQLSQLWLFTSGATGDVAAHFGRRTQFSASYLGGYSYNQRYPAQNGAHHTVSLDLRTDPARHTVFTLSAEGDSGVMSDALFDPSYTLSVARQASSVDQLSHGLLEDNPGSLLNSPLELAVSGGRRRSGAAYASVTHSYSRRFSSYLRVTAAREMRSYSREQQVPSQYPNVTIGMADLGLAYLLSTRTRITGTVSYTRSYSRQYGADWQSSGLGIERQFGRRSFGSLQAGYVRMSDPRTGGFGRSSYSMSGVLGTTKGFHTIAMTFRRGVSDLHGLGSDSSLGFDGAWSWAPHTSAWTMGSSFGYERTQGGGFGSLQASVGQANAVRRLTAHLNMAFAFVYMRSSFSDIAGFTRAGLRVSFVWTPGLEHRR